MNSDGKIHIKGKTLKRLQPGQQPVVRLSPDAYNTLVDLANESQWGMNKIASEIIIQSADNVVFDRDDEPSVSEQGGEENG